ncbi:MAG: hypothetical protein JJ975_05890 [Bacteroidia bacterium]|nr:hypothetical protein [Bacteroidia bacterium]
MNFTIEKILSSVTVGSVEGMDQEEFKGNALIVRQNDGMIGVYIPDQGVLYMEGISPRLEVVE